MRHSGRKAVLLPFRLPLVSPWLLSKQEKTSRVEREKRPRPSIAEDWNNYVEMKIKKVELSRSISEKQSSKARFLNYMKDHHTFDPNQIMRDCDQIRSPTVRITATA